MPLTPAQLATLANVCDTLLPSLDAAADPSGYWRRAARDLHVAEAVAEAIERLPSAQDQAELQQLLSLFENTAANLALCGKPVRFSALGREAQEQYLRDWEHSLLPLKRQGFQALKRLAAFTYFAAVDEKGQNPNWAALGYPGPLGPSPVSPKRITPIQRSAFSGQQPVLACDVVVVGSGAGGGVIAAELAAAGYDVIVVERGGYIGEPDYSQREAEMTRKLFWNGGNLVTRDSAYLLLAGSCLGGGTTVNWNTSFRPPHSVRERWEHEHGLDGLIKAEFDTSIDVVCERISMGTSETVVNAQNERLRRGATALGYHSALIPRNVRGCGNGDECGYCTFGCKRGAKQGALQTFLQDANMLGARFLLALSVVRVSRSHPIRLAAELVWLVVPAVMLSVLLLLTFQTLSS